MATAIIRPTSFINHSGSFSVNNVPNLFDDNLTTYANGKSTSQGFLILQGFNFSDLSSALNGGGRITRLTVCLYSINQHSNSSSDPSIRLVYNATSTESYTDCGDGGVKLDIKNTSTPQLYRYEYSKAVSYWNNNISSLLNGGFQVRLANLYSQVLLHELYLEVEYEVPTITVTTTASPPEGGTVTGGGVHEVGAPITLIATPNSGYKFSHWVIFGTPSDYGQNVLTGIEFYSDATVTAVFEKLQTTSSKLYYGSDTAKSVFDTSKKKAKSVWYGKTQIL